MTQPIMQVPVAMAPMALAPVAPVAPAAFAAETQVVVPRTESVVLVESAAPRRFVVESSALRTFRTNESALVVRPRGLTESSLIGTSESAVANDLDMARIEALVNEVRSIRDDLAAQRGAAESAEVARQAEIESLRAEVKALDKKFEDFKRCIAACVTAKTGG